MTSNLGKMKDRCVVHVSANVLETQHLQNINQFFHLCAILFHCTTISSVQFSLQLFSPMDLLDPVFVVSGLAGLLACFTLVCELKPKEASRWNSNAWSSLMEYNFGPKSFEFQLVLYDLFHTSQLCQLTHYSLFLDGLAWFQFLFHYCGESVLLRAVFCVLCVVMAFQAFTYLRWFVAPFMCLFYASLVLVIPPLPLSWIPWILILSPSIRVAGHFVERAPPQMFDGKQPQMTFREATSLEVFFHYAKRDPFVLLWAPIVGWSSELQAGLPFRLLPVATFYVLPRSWTRHCIQAPADDAPTLCFDWKQIDQAATAILKFGWAAWPETRALFS